MYFYLIFIKGKKNLPVGKEICNEACVGVLHEREKKCSIWGVSNQKALCTCMKYERTKLINKKKENYFPFGNKTSSLAVLVSSRA